MANICARSSPRKPLKAIQASSSTTTLLLKAKHQRPLKKRPTTNNVPTTIPTPTPFPSTPLRCPPSPQQDQERPNVIRVLSTPPPTPTNELTVESAATPVSPLPNHHHHRRVRFAGTAQVVLVRKRSDEEKRRAWYNSADYHQFDEDRRRTLRHYAGQQQQIQQQQSPTTIDSDDDDDMVLVEDDTEEEEETMTLAGLEGHVVREVALQRKRMTRYHCYNVLRQQYYNRYWYGMTYGDEAMESLRQTSLYYSSPMVLGKTVPASSSATAAGSSYYNNNGSNNYYSHECQQQQHEQQQQRHHHHEGYRQALMQRSILKML
jgi:hypothetical protein